MTDTPKQAGLQPYQERARKPLTGSGFNSLQIEHLKTILIPQIIQAVLAHLQAPAAAQAPAPKQEPTPSEPNLPPPGAIEATEQNTPGATPAMILLINEQESQEARDALRQIAMQTDIPHQARLPKMRAFLNSQTP